MFDPHTKQSLL